MKEMCNMSCAPPHLQTEDEALHQVHDKVMATFLSSNMLFPGVWVCVRGQYLGTCVGPYVCS